MHTGDSTFVVYQECVCTSSYAHTLSRRLCENSRPDYDGMPLEEVFSKVKGMIKEHDGLFYPQEPYLQWPLDRYLKKTQSLYLNFCAYNTMTMITKCESCKI